jgi:hypothetical protein
VAHLIGGLIYPDEGFKFKTLSTSTIFAFVFIGIITIGLLASWKYELQGGVVAMAGYLSFVFIALLNRGGGPNLIRNWPLFVCFLCGALFVGCWYSDRRKLNSRLNGEHN